MPLPPSLLAEAERHAAGLRSAPRRSLVLRTGMPAEGRSAAAAIAAALGLRAALHRDRQDRGLRPLAASCAGCSRCSASTSARASARRCPPLAGYDGPVLALGGPDGSVEITGEPAPLSWIAPGPAAGRAARALAAGPGRGSDHDDLAAELARHHRHGSGRIATLGRLARHRAASPGATGRPAPTWPPRPGAATAPASTRWPSRSPTRSPTRRWSSPEPLRQELRPARSCAAGRATAWPTASASRRGPATGRACAALFVGPSGTGKTLAAGWLATRLGMPLYRVDLAAVTSKYIGETEKNLAQLLARAEQAEVVLLFDEADSLFGKRTDVKDSNDRFANAQTNYLLQRIETFDGIALLTSNSRARFDAAFTRRLDAILDFPLPGPEERRALWRSHLGDGHRLPPAELNQLAAPGRPGRRPHPQRRAGRRGPGSQRGAPDRSTPTSSSGSSPSTASWASRSPWSSSAPSPV